MRISLLFLPLLVVSCVSDEKRSDAIKPVVERVQAAKSRRHAERRMNASRKDKTKQLQSHPPKLDNIDECFEDYSKFHPFATGEIVIRYRVTAKTGDLKDVRIVNSSFEDGAFLKCVVKDLKSWFFPHRNERQDETFQYHLIFRQGAKATTSKDIKPLTKKER